MAIEIKVPALGEGVETGDVLEVFVNVGDTVTKDQGLIELETDKATVTIPATSAGKVAAVLVKNGETVKIGQVIVTLEGAAATAAPAPAAKPPVATPAATPVQTPVAPALANSAPAAAAPASAAPAAPTSPAATPATASQSKPSAPSQGTVAASAVTAPAAASESAASGMVPAGPAMRRFAREVGVDLTAVSGSGAHGRITRDDILQVVRQTGSGARIANVAKSGTQPNAAAGESQDAYGPVRLEKLSKIRATIAQKMHESWSTIPRVTNFDDADVTDLEQIRQNNKKQYEDRGIKLTTMPFLIKAVAMALKNHPVINASIDVEKNQIIYKDYVNIGIAVDSDRGLVVPALRNVDKLAIPDIARQLSELADRVRKGEFGVDDLRGGTFTISNLGAIGGTYSTPIINYPETAILLAGRSRKMPVVKNDQIAVRLMMPLSISYDHRLIDGAAAARFLNDVIAYLESPSRLLLAL